MCDLREENIISSSAARDNEVCSHTGETSPLWLAEQNFNLGDRGLVTAEPVG